jgi:hypothetical protein
MPFPVKRRHPDNDEDDDNNDNHEQNNGNYKDLFSPQQQQQQQQQQSKRKPTASSAASLSVSAAELQVINNNNEEDASLEDQLLQGLSQRDLTLETALRRLTDQLVTQGSSIQIGEGEGGAGSETTADEMTQDWMKQISRRISDISPTLSHRLGPLINHILTQKANSALAASYISVPVPESDLTTTCLAYRAAFDTWVDAADCVSFQVKNTALLGHLGPKDYYLLTLFAMATTRRSKGDNMLSLGCTGISSCGKSTFIESPLMPGSHVYTCDAGVGRFDVQSKVILFAHDIPIDVLVTGKDSDKFRTLCRSEPTVAKTFGSTVSIPSVWVCFTSNQRLLDHSFVSNEGHFLPRIYSSQACSRPGAKVAKAELLSAMQNGVCEMFIRKKPPVDPKLLPRQGSFRRLHLVMGLYRRVASILADKQPGDFYSNMICLYVISGLCKHFKTFARLFPEEAEDMCNTLECLIDTLMPSGGSPVDYRSQALSLLTSSSP